MVIYWQRACPELAEGFTLSKVEGFILNEIEGGQGMRIAVGCDHRGVALKHSVIKLTTEMGHTCEDLGTYDTESVDYPDIAERVAMAVASGKCSLGILICDSGIGMCIAANKVKGIRAALCHDAFDATRARLHNDANILCLGAANGGEERAPEIVRTFLTVEFEGGRHQRRLDKIRDIEGQTALPVNR